MDRVGAILVIALISEIQREGRIQDSPLRTGKNASAQISWDFPAWNTRANSRNPYSSVCAVRRIAETETRFMEAALRLARKAAQVGETPVGAVIVIDGEIVGTGHNRVELDNNPTAHAEIEAIREAALRIGDWRLPRSTIYVTLEPCIMCAAALIHARVQRVVYGTRDTRWGGLGSLFDLSHDPRINHELEVIPGVMEEEAADLLKEFFRRVRKDTPAQR